MYTCAGRASMLDAATWKKSRRPGGNRVRRSATRTWTGADGAGGTHGGIVASLAQRGLRHEKISGRNAHAPGGCEKSHMNAHRILPTLGLEPWQLLAAIVVALVVYFVPSIVAYARGHHNRLAILVLNMFLGWSFLGWVVALVWAATHVQRDDRLARSQFIRQEPTLEDTTDR